MGKAKPIGAAKPMRKVASIKQETMAEDEEKEVPLMEPAPPTVTVIEGLPDKPVNKGSETTDMASEKSKEMKEEDEYELSDSDSDFDVDDEETEPPSELDLTFVIDCTASMGPYIFNVKQVGLSEHIVCNTNYSSYFVY